MILKALISVIFVAAAVQKLTGKVASSWERWGYPRQVIYATGIAEIVALALLWSPGLQFVGAAALGVVLLVALTTLLRYHEERAHVAFTGLTLVLIVVESYRSIAA
jgi:hypothetical protein